MASSAGRRLRPLAVVCALLMIAWGVASIASLVVQIMNYDEFGWPDENADGEIWAYVLLYLAAAASGAWVAVWGLFGLAWRPPLHLGGLALLVAIAVEVAANIVQVSYFSDLGAPVDLGDQAESYVERVTFDTGAVDGEGRLFFTALPLTTALLPLLTWLVVLFSGAGRKRKPTPFNTAYAQPQQYQQPYQQPQQPYQQQPYQQPPQQQPQQQQPQQQQPPAPPPPQPRVAWQQAPAVLPPARPTPTAPPPAPDQQTRPYPGPPKDS